MSAQVATLPADLPLSSLKTIDIQKLRDNDHAEKLKLLSAAQEEGFFYLDFGNLNEFEDFKDVIDGIYQLEENLFNLSTEEKMAFDVDTYGPMKLNGYKPIGRNRGGVDGKKDGFESWAIPKDGVLNIDNAPFPRPAVLDMSTPLLELFMSYMQNFTSTMHKALSDALNVDSPLRFENFHREGHSSPCILRLLKYQPQPATERGAPQTPHTDLGSWTVLFTGTPGLQTLAQGSTDNWTYVAPKAHCAIVNVGDALSMMTGGNLSSSLHRVGPLPGQPMPTRYSFAYLQRPEAHTVLKVPGTDGQEVTSGEWLQKKFGMLRGNTYEHGTQWILTGRKENVIAP